MANPEFERWWATKTAAGYQYGREALENVRFGFEGAQEMRWQLIDTAPKDRTLVLVALIKDGKVWRVSEASFNGLGWYDVGGKACHWRTHWMPLPDPPSLEQAG